MERDNLPLRISLIIVCVAILLFLAFMLRKDDYYEETIVEVEIVDVIQSENFLGHATYQTKVSYDNEVYTIKGDTAYYFAKATHNLPLSMPYQYSSSANTDFSTILSLNKSSNSLPVNSVSEIT